LLEIRQDEIRHYDSFLNIYRKMTGTQPKLTGAQECPRNYRKGLLASFKDEQDTTDFYRTVAAKTAANYVEDVFF
jgi:rubrerythrin